MTDARRGRTQPIARHEVRWNSVGLSLTTVAAVVTLAIAALSVVVAPVTWLTPILAAAATVGLALDRRIGWLPAGLAALIAIPYGRAADTVFIAPAGFPIRPSDVVIALAVLGAITQLPRCWRSGIRRQPTLLLAFVLFAVLGVVAFTIGLVEGHALRDIGRDIRFWVLYLAGALALLAGVTRPALIRGLMVGTAVFAGTVVLASVLPAFAGGLKSQVLEYDSGTLRMQFSNHVFLLPTLAFCASRLTRRFSLTLLVVLVIVVAAIVLSLTRMSIFAALGVVVLALAIQLWRESRGEVRLAALRHLLIPIAGCVTGVAVAGLISVTQVASTADNPSAENAMDRIFWQSDQSSIDRIVSAPGGRITSYLEAIAIVREAPVLGAGLGQLVPVPFAYSELRAHVIGMQPGVDNVYLTFGVKAGLVGMAAIAAILVWPLFAMARGASRQIRPWFLAGWLGILALTLTQSFASSGYGPFGIALLVAFPSLRRVDNSEPVTRKKPREANIRGQA